MQLTNDRWYAFEHITGDLTPDQPQEGFASCHEVVTWMVEHYGVDGENPGVTIRRWESLASIEAREAIERDRWRGILTEYPDPADAFVESGVTSTDVDVRLAEWGIEVERMIKPGDQLRSPHDPLGQYKRLVIRKRHALLGPALVITPRADGSLDVGWAPDGMEP